VIADCELRVTESKAPAILERHALNRTGCVGISIVRSASNRRDGTTLTYFSVHMRLTRGLKGKRQNRKFCVDTLGRDEAWRRALKCRADYEQLIKRRACLP
jgi:hypothetical protein